MREFEEGIDGTGIRPGFIKIAVNPGPLIPIQQKMVRAAARALDLDFVPVGWERYDLVIPREYYESPVLAPLLALLGDEMFRAAVSTLPGYETREMGQIVKG